MNVLVLGGNGFIGSHLVDELAARSHSVRVFDRAAPLRPRNGVEYLAGNFLASEAIASSLDGIDVVYHLVSTSVPSTSNLNPIKDVQENLVGTLQLLEEMKARNVRKIVYLSSGGTVYGNPVSLPVQETHPLSPICSYGVVKVAIENYLYMYQQLYGFEPIVLRASNPYGPRQGHVGIQGAVQTFLKRVLDGEPIKIWGDGSVRRDYLYIADLVDLCVRAAESTRPGVYNAGSGKSHSLSELLQVIATVTGTKPVVEYLEGRAFDVAEIALDVALARKAFGWNPDITIEEGVRRQWQWLTNEARGQL